MKENIAVLFPRQAITEKFGFFVSRGLTDINYTGTAGQFGAGLVFPLYLYSETFDKEERTPNFNMEIVKQIEERLSLQFVTEKDTSTSLSVHAEAERSRSFAPIDLLDYIYAVLHSPTYREKYKEFLKIDFPRVPFPKDAATFWELVELGKQIREIHLLESPVVEKFITQYPEDGDNIVTKPRFVIANEVKQSNDQAASFLAATGRVYINETQYFANVPEVAWNFYIGGYQPAQKWLKDRKDRELEFDDILHYQKIIVALSETDQLMQEVDMISKF